jgi:hypothetical protein
LREQFKKSAKELVAEIFKSESGMSSSDRRMMMKKIDGEIDQALSLLEMVATMDMSDLMGGAGLLG